MDMLVSPRMLDGIIKQFLCYSKENNLALEAKQISVA